MSGWSEYRPRDSRVISFVWLFVSGLLFGGGMVAFVVADTYPGLLGSFALWMSGLISAGVWVEWRSR